MNEYELLYIVTPRRSADEVPQIVEWVEGLIGEAGGEVLTSNNWGRRRLAYPINGEFEGTYVLTTLRMPPAAAAGLESAMAISEDIFRQLLIRGIVPSEDDRPPPELVGERPRPAPLSVAPAIATGPSPGLVESAEAAVAAEAPPAAAEPAPAEAPAPGEEPAPAAEPEEAAAPAEPSVEAPTEPASEPERSAEPVEAE